ncbi:MAG TPA: TraC family protein [Candidatus Saccharimonadales bacterium]|nr:TraC family protein [Candidatus Saccharimonadales bacterium]
MSSRRQISIKSVEDDVLVLPGNKYRAILEVAPINLALKSIAEKDAIIENYQSFLNALPCSIQVLIKTRRLDVDNYLEQYADLQKKETSAVYKAQLEDYQNYVKELIKKYKILSRRFYLVIPYDGRDKPSLEMVKDQLNLNVGIIENNLEGLGMKARRLTSMEILDLFYTYYNPTLAKLQPLKAETMHMLATQYI